MYIFQSLLILLVVITVKKKKLLSLTNVKEQESIVEENIYVVDYLYSNSAV